METKVRVVTSTTVKRTHPEGARREGNHATPETGLFALRCDTFIDTFPEPDIGLHVPRVQKDLEVGWELDLHDFDVGCAFPLRPTLRIEASESKTGEDGGTLRGYEVSYNPAKGHSMHTSVSVQMA